MDTTSSWTLVLKNLLPYLKLMFAFVAVVVNKMMHLLGGYLLTTFFGRRGTQRGEEPRICPSASPHPLPDVPPDCLAGVVLGILGGSFTWRAQIASPLLLMTCLSCSRGGPSRATPPAASAEYSTDELCLLNQLLTDGRSSCSQVCYKRRCRTHPCVYTVLCAGFTPKAGIPGPSMRTS